MIVDPSSNQMGCKGVYAAKSLVNAKGSVSVVCMVNPNDTVRQVRKWDMIDEAEHVDLAIAMIWQNFPSIYDNCMRTLAL